MPSGITINGVFLPRVSLGSLDSKKEELEDYIKSLEQKLLALAAQSPTVNRDCEGNEMPWHDYVTAEVNELLQEYKDTSRDLYLVHEALATLQYAPEDVRDDHFLDSGDKWKRDHGYTKGLKVEATPGPAFPESEMGAWVCPPADMPTDFGDDK